jgi:hypothetical protein
VVPLGVELLIEPVAGGVVVVVVVLESAGGVVGAVAEVSAGVPVEVVVEVLALVSGVVSDFLLHAVRPRLAAARSAPAATRAVREDPVSI